METILKTRFPILAVEETKVFGIVGQWISKNRDFSKYFNGSSNLVDRISKEPEVLEIKDCKTKITKTTLDFDKNRFSGFEFLHPGNDGDDVFCMKMSYCRDCEEKVAEVTLVLDHGCAHHHRVMKANKPLLVNMLIDGIPNSFDGWIINQTTPLQLIPSDARVIAQYINATERSNQLPVLYVCRLNQDNSLILDSDLLAKKLAGLAHVFVEPDSSFSREVKFFLKSKEMACYDGAVRLYWPGATDPRLNRFWLKEALDGTIGSFGKGKDPVEEIKDYIISRTRGISLGFCSYESIVNMKRKLQMKSIYDAMKQETEQDKLAHQEFVALSEEIISSHEIEQRNLEGQVRRLADENAAMREDLKIAQINLQDSRVYAEPPVSKQLVTNSDVLLMINSFWERHKDSDSISPHYKQKITHFMEERAEDITEVIHDKTVMIAEIANAFNGYTRLNPHCVSVLRKYGFSYTEDGPHYKVSRVGFTPGTCVTLAKTPSTSRAGKYFVTDMMNTFFKI